MKKEKNIHVALLSVHMYKFTENDFYELRHGHNRPNTVFEFLPEFTINKSTNKIVDAKYYLQYVGLIKNESHDIEELIFVDFGTLDAELDNEISHCGYEELLNPFDIKKILSVFEPNTYNDFTKHMFPKTNYLVIETEYISSRDYINGGYDVDVKYDIVGYLENSWKFVAYKKNND